MAFSVFSVRVHLWDLSGHPEYLDVRNELYTNTDAVFIVYDVTNQVLLRYLVVRPLSVYGHLPLLTLGARRVGVRIYQPFSL